MFHFKLILNNETDICFNIYLNGEADLKLIDGKVNFLFIALSRFMNVSRNLIIIFLREKFIYDISIFSPTI